MSEETSALQERIGRRGRTRRHEVRLTLGELAERAGVSARFLSDLEAGRANISISRLQDVAVALGLSLTRLIEPSSSGPRAAIARLLEGRDEAELERLLTLLEVNLGRRSPRLIAVMGVRGCGKSTIGAGLAAALSLPFIELDARIEARAGMSLGDIFTLHGEPFFRALQLDCLQQLVSSGERAVVALPGGIVASEQAWALSGSACTRIWLQATAEDLWARVFAQGDTRPMQGREDAMADLRALMRSRRPLYAQAELVADTSGASVDQILRSLVAELDARGLLP